MLRRLISLAILLFVAAAPARASIERAALFWDVCISVFELDGNAQTVTRNDLAARVSAVAQDRMREADQRNVLAAPNCIKGNQPGFDRQLEVFLSVKKQKVKVEGADWNLVIVGGVSTNGLFQDREFLPTIILQPDAVSGEKTIDALVEFFDRSVVRSVKLARQK